MGVPALFRWLSKQYPKIVSRVQEEDPVQIPSDDDPEQMVNIPIDITGKNPNGTEFDNLYLDMNGIVHPCTHPEGKPAPETEEDMMLEIFEYTERVVAMVRPRKLLFMAIDGVAPRAKMNQQRSRRFRASQEAAEKEKEKEEAIALFAAMGHPVSDETKNKKAWDSNAITPGTPFMDLLAASLRYWVVQKMNTDAAWKNIQVIISDASVPGEGEHKIMDFIRRQRTNPDHNPNTEHVIYGLDADLIMLALATHEPHFKVLREDVFFQPNGGAGCRKCGELGHMAAQCTGAPKPVVKFNKPLSETKPFIFLDVAVLREYLEVFLDVPGTPFAFDLERAIDDWVFLIFFVGNDFLPHLPSLEIREGAIDTLIRIWKAELPRMGGYVTNHGRIELARAEVILEGLAKSEDDIFRKRREAEDRQEANSKRRKVEEARRGNYNAPRERDTGGQDTKSNLVGMQVNGETLVQVTPAKVVDAKAAHPSLPSRPAFDLVPAAAAAADPAATAAAADKAKGVKALAGSNNDVVANRRAIRMANMSAAEMLKAELGGVAGETVDADVTIEEVKEIADDKEADAEMKDKETKESTPPPAPAAGPDAVAFDAAFDAAFPPPSSEVSETPSRGVKRKADEEEDTIDGELAAVDADDDDAPPVAELTSIPHMDQPVPKTTARTVNADGTVEYEDTVKLWEPGYQERYYREKFGVELSDKAFRRQLATHYVEGLSWVLHYYYQGTPSWQWYYPYHYAPFAADFGEVSTMDIQFTLGAPFKPFEQLMGVFPAASKVHIPEIFHDLMTDEMSPILDFYPEDFEIDMNGKKMQWQGVALLPFIDPVRLLKEMTPRYSQLSEDDTRRNTWGNDVLFVADDHPLYDSFCKLYTKKKTSSTKVPIDTRLSGGIAGFVLHDPTCIPGSTYYSPLPSTTLGDIYDDHSLSTWYFFPEQLSPHKSVMLKGVNRAKRILNQGDLDRTRRGANDTRGRGGGGHMGGPGMGGGGRGRGSAYGTPYGGTPDRSYNNSPAGSGYGGGRGGGGGGGPSNSYNGQSRGAGGRDSYGSQQQQPQGGQGYGGGAYQPQQPPQQSYGAGPQSYDRPPQPRGGGGYSLPPPPPTLPVQQAYGGYGGYGGGGQGGYAPPPPQSYPSPGQPQGYGNYVRGGDSGVPPPPQNFPPQNGQYGGQQQQQGGSYGGYGGYGGGNGGGRGGYDNSRGGRGGQGGGRY